MLQHLVASLEAFILHKDLFTGHKRHTVIALKQLTLSFGDVACLGNISANLAFTLALLTKCRRVDWLNMTTCK